MKLSLFYKYLILISIFICPSINANIDENLEKITSKLRCMTCQNQTIHSSSTDFSTNIKTIVRNKLEENKSEKEIMDFLIYRYGEYIIFEPRKNLQNLFLWLFPFVILALSLVFLVFRINKNS